jgi:hypothetical protein
MCLVRAKSRAKSSHDSDCEASLVHPQSAKGHMWSRSSCHSFTAANFQIFKSECKYTRNQKTCQKTVYAAFQCLKPVTDLSAGGIILVCVTQPALTYIQNIYVDGHPQSRWTLNQSLHGEPNLGDSSEPLFSIYSKAAEEEDNKMVRSWQKDAEGILIFVSPCQRPSNFAHKLEHYRPVYSLPQSPRSLP